MAATTRAEPKSVKGNRKTTGGGGGNARRTERETLDEAIELILANLITSLKDRPSGTISELLKLLSFRRELEGERPKEVIVRWVEPSSET